MTSGCDAARGSGCGPLPAPSELARRYGIAADRRLGQHFLFDPRILEKIAAAAAPFTQRRVVEIGAGPGGLTRALLDLGAEEVIAVEIDARCVRALRELERAACGRLRILEKDALSLRLAELAGGRPLVLVGNLPFNLASRLLVRWLHELDPVERMVLMFQKEVAARIVARPGTRAYGRLSVLAQRLCRIEKLFDIAPGSFRPPPRVEATVLRLQPRSDRPDGMRLSLLERITAAAFGKRRKMLRASLAGFELAPERWLARAGIDPGRRAEELTLEDFDRLVEVLMSLQSPRPGTA